MKKPKQRKENSAMDNTTVTLTLDPAVMALLERKVAAEEADKANRKALMADLMDNLLAFSPVPRDGTAAGTKAVNASPALTATNGNGDTTPAPETPQTPEQGDNGDQEQRENGDQGDDQEQGDNGDQEQRENGDQGDDQEQGDAGDAGSTPPAAPNAIEQLQAR